jgi:hypothetical protein
MPIANAINQAIASAAKLKETPLGVPRMVHTLADDGVGTR